MARGEGYASSRFLSAEEKAPAGALAINQGSLDRVSVIVCAEDKGRRKDVLYFLPELSLVFPGQCPWQGAFAEAYSGLGYMYQDWAKAGPDAATVLGVGSVWARLADGVTLKPAARTKAFACWLGGSVVQHGYVHPFDWTWTPPTPSPFAWAPAGIPQDSLFRTLITRIAG